MAVAAPRRTRAQTNPEKVAITAGVAVFVLLALYALLRCSHSGIASFFGSDDSTYFRAAAGDPFGNGHVISAVGRPGEAAYRYGHILLPLLAWVTAAGHRGAVAYTLVFWNLASIAACVTFAGLLVHELGGDARLGPLVLLAPGLLGQMHYVYAEPLSIALVLAGYWLHAKGREGGAIGLLAAAALARETAILALVPLLWDALRRRDPGGAVRVARGAIPLALWSAWVWLRVGALPEFAHTWVRSEAVGLPFVALARLATDTSRPDRLLVPGLVILTCVLCCCAWARRPQELTAQAALVFGLFALCLGPNVLRFPVDTLRLLACAQVLGIVVGASVLKGSMQRVE